MRTCARSHGPAVRAHSARTPFCARSRPSGCGCACAEARLARACVPPRRSLCPRPRPPRCRAAPRRRHHRVRAARRRAAVPLGCGGGGGGDGVARVSRHEVKATGSSSMLDKLQDEQHAQGQLYKFGSALDFLLGCSISMPVKIHLCAFRVVFSSVHAPPCST